MTGYSRGHSYHWDHERDIYVWSDTSEEVDFEASSYADRPCAHCKQSPTRAGHDPCIADLPEVRFACCGHGVTIPYVTLKDGGYLRNGAALEFFRSQGKEVPA